jgi:membrane protease YdiL (CAAX protease family)
MSAQDQASRAAAPRGGALLAFFVLVFALAAPCWLIGALTGLRLTADLPVAALQFVCPVIAAAILVYRERGSAGLSALLRRSLDFSRINAKIWYVPTVLLLPGIYAVTYALMRLQGLPAPTPEFPLLAALVLFLVYLFAGVCEELGWSGYALDPMQARWNALAASLLLGTIWGAFHVIPLLQAGRSPEWIAWWALSTVTLRVHYTWLYNNTGESVFAAALFHATGNLAQIGPFLNFGPGGYPLDAQRIAGLLIAAAAVIVVILWGPQTLTRFTAA